MANPSARLQPLTSEELTSAKEEIEEEKNELSTPGTLIARNQTAFIVNAEVPAKDDFSALGDGTRAWWMMGTHSIPQHIIEQADENVLALLPAGTEVISIHPHEKSTWSRTANMQTELDGNCVSYFIKATDYRSGRIMYHSEYGSLKAIHDAVPGICPEPIGWGHYASDPSVFFLLCHFVHIFSDLPSINLLPARMAQLHDRAIAKDGNFGWHVPIAGGQMPVIVAKSHSWEDLFTRYMRYMFRAEEITQGPRTPEIERLTGVLFNRIIPRLLRPLETGGRELIPRLLHTDLWTGNLGVNDEGDAIVFDPMSMYGHNEMDIGVWNNARQKTGMPFINKYHSLFPRSAPEEDSYGRILLYTLAFNVRIAATKIDNPIYRDDIARSLAELDNLYPETYEEWAKSRNEPPPFPEPNDDASNLIRQLRRPTNSNCRAATHPSHSRFQDRSEVEAFAHGDGHIGMTPNRLSRGGGHYSGLFP
ncbi:Fructosamine kinase-domain-containing protein [Apiospora hydei]|uniref:protein-ribulosamine 3-kinase n=1 Tax=Apiospora hydei TaxID=1337664 RepID=A0ABR1XE94_9PEZI